MNITGPLPNGLAKDGVHKADDGGFVVGIQNILDIQLGFIIPMGFLKPFCGVLSQSSGSIIGRIEGGEELLFAGDCEIHPSF